MSVGILRGSVSRSRNLSHEASGFVKPRWRLFCFVLFCGDYYCLFANSVRECSSEGSLVRFGSRFCWKYTVGGARGGRYCTPPPSPERMGDVGREGGGGNCTTDWVGV